MRVVFNNSKLVFGVVAKTLTPFWKDDTHLEAIKNTAQNVGNELQTQTAGSAAWTYHKYSVTVGKEYEVKTCVRGNYAPSIGLCWAYFTDDNNIIKGAFCRVMNSDVSDWITDSSIAVSGSTTLHVFGYSTEGKSLVVKEK